MPINSEEFYLWLRDLPELLLMYLGIWVFSGGSAAFQRRRGLAKHPISFVAQNIAEWEAAEAKKADWTLPTEPQPSASKAYPLIQRDILFNPDDLSLAVKNIVHLRQTSRQLVDKMGNLYTCLRLRLKGLRESEIQERLDFESAKEFADWKQLEHIGLHSDHSDQVLERWLAARERLFGEESDSAGDLVEVRHPREIYGWDYLEGSDQVILFSYDFSSAKVGGRRYYLNPAQADAVRPLHEEYPDDLYWPNLRTLLCKDHGRSEETYKTLRKVFRGNEEAFSSMIEKVRNSRYRLKYKGFIENIDDPVSSREQSED
jgi:hypothetical protein